MAASQTRTKTSSVDERAEWPYASLFLFGYFGSDTPAGRRLRNWSLLFIGLMLASIMVIHGADGVPLLQAVGALGLPLAVIVMFRASARYLRDLDEVGRAIQLKGYAFSYGVVMTAASAAAGGIAVIEGPAPALDPILCFAGLFAAAELVRGLALVVLARDYR